MKNLLWDNSCNIQQNLDQALMVYNSLLELNDFINEEEYEFRMSEFNKKVADLDYQQYWMDPKLLANAERLHNEIHDFSELTGTIVVLKYADKFFILDGNHRLEYVLRKKIKTQVFITEFNFPEPTIHINYFFPNKD